MTDLLVIHPGAAHGIYGSDLANSLVAVEPPLWARLIAGYVRDSGFSVKILDAEAAGFSADQAADHAAAIGAHLNCIAVYGHQPSASTQQMDAAIKISRGLKDRVAGPVILVGGHVSALPEQSLKESGADYVGIGEGPVTIVGLLRKYVQGWIEAIPGLMWRSDVGFGEHMPAELIPMDKLHGNVWDLLPMSLYRAHNWQCFDDLSRRQPYASIMTSLGCPYKCGFCCINAPFGTNAYRMRRPADVVTEIIHLNRVYGVKTFKIVDEMFILNERHYTEICNLIISSQKDKAIGLDEDLNFWAYSRVDTVKPDKLALLRRAGFKWLALGIESESEFVRDGSQKRLKTNDIRSVVTMIQAHDINVIANYIFGLPDDNMESMRKTLWLAQELNTEFANFYSAMAYPGSPLYDMAVKEGRTLPMSWRGYSQHNSDCRPLDTNYIHARDVLRFRDDAFNTYFTSPRYLDMIAAKFGPAAVEHVKAMTTIKLSRKLLEAA